MSGTNDPQVVGAETQGVPAGTPLPESQQPPAGNQTPNDANGQSPASVTPPQPSSSPVTQADLNRMKSVFQQQQAQQARQAQQREQQYQQQLDAERMRGMDENQRKAYEQQRMVEANQQLWQQNQQMAYALQQSQQAQEYVNWFRERGVPASELSYDGDMDDLLARGWQAIDKRLMGPNGGQQQQSRQQLQAPPVVTGAGSISPANSWAALRAEYKGWSDEEIYRAVEQGVIPASKIPIPSE